MSHAVKTHIKRIAKIMTVKILTKRCFWVFIFSLAVCIAGIIKQSGKNITSDKQSSSRPKTISINIPPGLKDRKIKEIRIIPKANARYFEVQYTYEAECIQSNLNKDNALAIDLGIDNLCSCVTSTGSSFIIDGRRLKSINQWYNKQNSYYQSIKDKQHINVKQTDRQYRLTNKRNRCVSDYLSKAARLIINYCLNNDIGNIVVGYNETFQKDVALGKITNQSFVQIPYGRLRDKLEYYRTPLYLKFF